MCIMYRVYATQGVSDCMLTFLTRLQVIWTVYAAGLSPTILRPTALPVLLLQPPAKQRKL